MVEESVTVASFVMAEESAAVVSFVTVEESARGSARDFLAEVREPGRTYQYSIASRRPPMKRTVTTYVSFLHWCRNKGILFPSPLSVQRVYA